MMLLTMLNVNNGVKYFGFFLGGALTVTVLGYVFLPQVGPRISEEQSMSGNLSYIEGESVVFKEVYSDVHFPVKIGPLQKHFEVADSRIDFVAILNDLLCADGCETIGSETGQINIEVENFLSNLPPINFEKNDILVVYANPSFFLEELHRESGDVFDLTVEYIVDTEMFGSILQRTVYVEQIVPDEACRYDTEVSAADRFLLGGPVSFVLVPKPGQGIQLQYEIQRSIEIADCPERA